VRLTVLMIACLLADQAALALQASQQPAELLQ